MRSKIKKGLLLTSKILVSLLVVVIILLTVAFFAFHNESVQDRLVKLATELLSDYLQTSVRIEKASVSIIDQDVHLYGVEIDDRHHRKMFQMKELGVDFDLYRLLDKEIKINKANVSDLTAQLYKPASDSDSVANYQFVIDAFKSHKQPSETVSKEKKFKMVLDISKVSLERIKATYNDTLQAQFSSLSYKKNGRGKIRSEVRDLTTSFVQQTKKGPVDVNFSIGVLNAVDKDGKRLFQIDELHYKTNNHRPRKNSGKPNRGAFDAGHFDILAKLNIEIDSVSKDTLVAQITSGRVEDRGSGLQLTELLLKVNANKRKAHLKDISIKLPNTQLSIANADIQLPNKKEQRKLAFTTSTINGRVLLKDIAKTFAPVLGKFSLPLNLQTRMSGNDNELKFSNVAVSTNDRKLTVNASGHISNLKDAKQLHVHFDVSKMSTDGVYAEKVINQFPVKKFMMKQLHALGRIGYQGKFDVLWKKEQFSGTLTTAVGRLNVNLTLDELNKYVFGTVDTNSLQIGKAMDMPDLGRIVCKADFKFDISKTRTAQMRRVKAGKLPIGTVNAQVTEGSYKNITVQNIVADIESDGAVATGNITVRGKRVDVLCGFSFTNTNEMTKIKTSPGVRFHKMSDEDKAEREKLKQEKKQAREERKQAKKQAREERKQKKETDRD